MSSSNFDVFLQTLNRSSVARPDAAASPANAAAPLTTESLQSLAPVMTTLLKHTAPVNVVQLATEAGVSITPLVLSLVRLKDSGVVEHDPSVDAVSLTPLGRQMLDVGRMIR